MALQARSGTRSSEFLLLDCSKESVFGPSQQDVPVTLNNHFVKETWELAGTIHPSRELKYVPVN